MQEFDDLSNLDLYNLPGKQPAHKKRKKEVQSLEYYRKFIGSGRKEPAPQRLIEMEQSTRYLSVISQLVSTFGPDTTIGDIQAMITHAGDKNRAEKAEK